MRSQYAIHCSNICLQNKLRFSSHHTTKNKKSILLQTQMLIHIQSNDEVQAQTLIYARTNMQILHTHTHTYQRHTLDVYSDAREEKDEREREKKIPYQANSMLFHRHNKL